MRLLRESYQVYDGQVLVGILYRILEPASSPAIIMLLAEIQIIRVSAKARISSLQMKRLFA